MTRPPSRRGGRAKRSPPERGPSRVGMWILLATLLLAVAAVPSASFETASLDRDGSVDVVNDPDGLLGVEHAESVSNQDESLVVVFNQFQMERTITVTLDSCTDATMSLGTDGEQNDGTLVESTTDRITFHLPSDGSQEVLVDITGTQCESIDTVTTTDDGLTTVELSRSATVDQGQGGGNDDQPGQGNGDPPGQGDVDPPGQADIGSGMQNPLLSRVKADDLSHVGGGVLT